MDIRTVGVAGSGTMGAGIAIVAARSGYSVICYDTAEAPLAKTIKQTEGFFQKSVEIESSIAAIGLGANAAVSTIR